MKKLFLTILVLGLLLVSCSEYSNESKIEKCADPKAMELGGGVATKKGKKVLVFIPDSDPLDLFKEENLKEMNKMSLKDKLAERSGRYDAIWDECEREFSQTPVKFKQKYLK